MVLVSGAEQACVPACGGASGVCDGCEGPPSGMLQEAVLGPCLEAVGMRGVL